MKRHIVSNFTKCLSLHNVNHGQNTIFSNLRPSSMSTGLIGTVQKSANLTLSSKYFATKSNLAKSSKDKKPVKPPTPQGKSLNSHYLHYVYVNTSRERWIEFEKGIKFDVGLFDSYANKEYDTRVPVILGIPRCTGTHEELVTYLSMFVMLGYRVIIPNLPGTRQCKGRTKAEEHIFTMSPNEKAQFIKDTLETIRVPQVDMLVTHWDSLHAGLELTSGKLFKLKNVKSLAIIDPLGLQYTKTMKPFWFYRRVSRLIETNKHLAPVIRLVLNTWKIFTEKRKWKSDEIMLFSRNVDALNFSEADLNAQRFKHSLLPTRVFYSDGGSTIDIPSTEELLGIMGLSKSLTTICDEELNIVSEGQTENNQRCFYFNDRETSSEKMTFIRTELVKFLKSVRPDAYEV